MNLGNHRCHFNHDAKQKDIESHFDINIGLPVLYITQIIGLAFGIPPKELGLHRNIVDPSRILEKLKATSYAAPKT